MTSSNLGENTDRAATTAPGGPRSGELDLADRHALRRVAGLSTELADVTEVEYRALRLERVVLVGVWTEGTLAERRELAARAVAGWPRPPGRRCSTA